MKATLEFTAVTDFPLVPCAPTVATSASQRVLALDPDTGDKTLVLYHPPSQEWGGEGGIDEPAIHSYVEECLILKGELFDKTLQETFGVGSFCCRPPGMVHGPWRAGPQGCEEIVWVRYASNEL